MAAASNASQLAIGQLASNIGGAAGEELGFDVFQIRQEPSRGLTLTAGRYLASRVFVSLQQPLRIGASTEQQIGGRHRSGLRAGVHAPAVAPQSRCAAAACPTSLLLRGRYAF